MLKEKPKHILSFFNYSKQLTDIEYKQKELTELKRQIIDWKKKASIIQSNFDFILPNYIIDEIIENEGNKNYLNLYYLINCAIINGRLSEENGKELRKEYLLKNQ